MDRKATHTASGTARISKASGSIALTLAAACPAVGYAQAGPCADPWINQAFHQIPTLNRAPIGSGKNVGECDVTRYGNGHWSSYQDLVTKIVQHQTGTHAMPVAASSSPVLVRPSTSGNVNSAPILANTSNIPASALHTTNSVPGTVPLTNASGIVSQGGGNIVSQGGGNIVSQGGGNVVPKNGSGIVSQGGGNVINTNGSNAVAKNAASLIGQDGNGFRANGR